MKIDPLTAAVARFRMTIYVGHLLTVGGVLPRPLRLDGIPHAVLPRVAVGDSLLVGRISRSEYEQAHTALAALPGAAFPLDDFAWPPEPDAPPSAAPANP